LAFGRGVAGAILAQRGHLFPWTPVAMGGGIWAYFLMPVEPGQAAILTVLTVGVIAAGFARPAGPVFGVVALALALGTGGFTLAARRAASVAAPVLEGRYYGPVEGRIVEIDRSMRDVPRLTLDQVRLDGVPLDKVPVRVRVSVHGDQPWLPKEPGTVVMLTGFLSPPNGPMEPDEFDFRRLAWFQQLGAVGYSETPVLAVAQAEGGAVLAVARWRAVLAEGVRARIEGDAGGLAAAVMTGDRSGLSQEANEDMRASNLYHLVSISGTHMAMLVAFVFGFIRYGVALIPPLALRVSAKKIAAVVALPIAAAYLVLAGRDMATERAFVMVAVMLVAVLLDRQAITLRSVAIAAFIVLGVRPEALVNPGFQMSFAASVALVAAFGALRVAPTMARRGWVGAVGLLLFSSLVAGLATAPFAAAHFNRVAHLGLVANLLAVPVMGMVVMPGAVLMAVLAPLGLEAPGVWLVEAGCRWILFVAKAVGGVAGAESAVVHPPMAVLPLVTAGGLWLCLWLGWGRWGGVGPCVLAFGIWAMADRPPILIAPGGGLVGVVGVEGRALNKATGDSFAADTWIANDGDVISQDEAFARPGWSGEGRVWRAEASGVVVLWVGGERATAAVEGCGGADVMVSNVDAGPRPCLVFDAARLAVTGAVAIDGDLSVRTAAGSVGERYWTGTAMP
jgi:competence protein ComEC